MRDRNIWLFGKLLIKAVLHDDCLKMRSASIKRIFNIF